MGSQVILDRWLGAVYEMVMATWQPWDTDRDVVWYRNVVLTAHAWANPVGLPKEHRSSQAEVRRYVRQRLLQDGLLTAEYLCGNANQD